MRQRTKTDKIRVNTIAAEIILILSGQTVTGLAQKTGINKSRLHSILKDGRKVTREELDTIAAALNVEVYKLVNMPEVEWHNDKTEEGEWTKETLKKMRAAYAALEVYAKTYDELT